MLSDSGTACPKRAQMFTERFDTQRVHSTTLDMTSLTDFSRQPFGNACEANLGEKSPARRYDRCECDHALVGTRPAPVGSARRIEECRTGRKATDNEEHSIGGARPQRKSAEWERAGAGTADRIR